MTDNDEHLLQQAIAGDRDALQTLIAQHHDQLEVWVRGHIPQRWQSVIGINDVLQETYVDAFLNMPRFVPDGEEAFRRWLFTIARNNLNGAITSLKAEKRGGRSQRVNTGDGVYADLLDLVVGSSTPSRKIARAEAATILKSALDKLPPHYRDVIQLYDIENLSIEQTAATLGKSAGAAFMMRRRALDALWKLLFEPLEDYSDYS